MKKKVRTLLLVLTLVLACATTSLACTPKLTPPKISIPTITNVKLPENVQEAVNKSAEKHAKEAVKNLKIDWSKIKFNFKF